MTVLKVYCLGVPSERTLRAQKTYEAYGVRMCFHSLLAVFGIPVSTAQTKLYVHELLPCPNERSVSS